MYFLITLLPAEYEPTERFFASLCSFVIHKSYIEQNKKNYDPKESRFVGKWTVADLVITQYDFFIFWVIAVLVCILFECSKFI